MKLSILTINYNNRNGLAKTMKSVFDQTFTDFEYIIVDGGSTDGSKELIIDNENNVQKWLSEKDNGIYHAMNKAIALAQGEYCFFLNSGDYLVIQKTIELVFSQLSTSDIISGNVLKVRSNGKWNRVKSPEIVSLHKLMKLSLPHQGSFIRRNLFDKVGLYTEKYKIISDWEFFLKALFKHNCSYTHVEIDVAYFMLDGISSTKSNFKIARIESEDCLENNFPEMKDDLVEYRYFHNSYIGIMYRQLKSYPFLYKLVEKFCEIVFNTKKWIFGK